MADRDGKAEPGLGRRWEGRASDLTRRLCLQVSRLTWFTRHDPVVLKEPPTAPLPPAPSQNAASDTDTQLEGVGENACTTPVGELPLPLVTAATCTWKEISSIRSQAERGQTWVGFWHPGPRVPQEWLLECG